MSPRSTRRRWESEAPRPGSREPLAFDYEAYLPDPIAGLDLAVPLGLVAEVEATARAVAELQGAGAFVGLEALARQLLRAESVGSSRIEGLALTQRRLARAMIDPEAEREIARAVLGNVRAMEEAIRLASSEEPFTMDPLLRIHRILLEDSSQGAIAGRLREAQNWIGGSDWSPHGAAFVPPPEGEVVPLLEDLFAFMAREDLPAILQAAIAHAQFETIHPFADGNGRVGRALIHSLLRRRGLTPRFVPPVSLVLATNAARYVESLTAYRAGDVVGWCLFFTRTLRTATERAHSLNESLQALQEGWRGAVGRPRSHSATERLIQALPAQPVLDLRVAAELAGGSAEGARRALNELEAAGVLSTVVVGKKRNRIWEARELLALVDAFEWEMAEPTRPGEPRRAAPLPPR